jgi:phosphatidylserine decarboxylase
MILFGFTLNFFRDPNRTPPKADNVVISPADGKVIIIKEVEADNFVRRRRLANFNFYVAD